LDFEVLILGCNSALAAHGRHPTAQLLRHHNKLFLIDCGEGTQMQLQKFKAKPFKIEQIFISHLHGDHYFGLIGLITTYHLLQRKTPLTVFGPKALEPIIRLQLEVANTSLCYELRFVATQTSSKELIYEDELLKVYSFPLYHRIPCTGYLFEEKKQLRKINKEKTKDLTLNPELYAQLRRGEDILDEDGVFHSNESLTLDVPAARKYAYCTDTMYSPSILEYIEHVNLLYHEATFMNDAQERAQQTFHSTTGQAGLMASNAHVQKLIIGHFSSKYIDLKPLLNESQQVFQNTELAEEGRIYLIE
jgi:ribonuclease Z